MSRKSVIEDRMKALEQELAQLDRWGEDNYKNGTVIRFKVQFQVGGVWYTYVATKVKGRWFITGNRMSYLTWDALVEFWSKANRVKGLKVATAWEEV